MAAPGPDGQIRCSWSLGTQRMLDYHDNEWGFPVAADQRLFEKLCLEGFQSGLSWRTILDKRESFRDAFANFDIATVAAFDDDDVERLVADAGIVRHRGKITAAINNAQRAMELVQQEGSLARFIWRFEAAPGALGKPQTLTQSDESVALSKELKRRGWRFVGPTTMFAFIQSMGLVNDHESACVTRRAVDAARSAFTPP